MRLRPLLDVLAGVALVVVGCVGYHRVFEGWSFLIRFGAAAVVAAALVALFTRGLLSRWWAVAAVAGALIPLQIVLVLSDTVQSGLPTGDTVSGLRDGFVDGWTDALNDFLPLADPSAVTVLLIAMVYAAAASTTALILHTDRVVPTVVPAVLLYALSLPLGAPAPDTSVLLVAGLIAAVLAVILLRSNPDGGAARHGVVRADDDFTPRRPLGRVTLLGGPMIVLVTVLGVGVSAVLGFGRTDDPFDPRDERSEALADRPVISPLDEFKAVRQQDPPAPAFTMAMIGGGDLLSAPWIRFAVFDSYDGRSWSSTERFERYDEELPSDDVRSGRVERLTISLEGFDSRFGPYLPVVGEARRIVDVSPVRFSPESGAVLAPRPMPPSVIEVVDVAVVGEEELAAAVVDPDPRHAALLQLPEAMPDVITAAATEAAADAGTVMQRLDALRQLLENSTAYALAAPSGQSVGQIAAFLDGEQRGNDVHYASALALMARSLGIPSRVAMGWTLPEDVPEGATVADLTSAEYRVWPEVRLAGIGWHPIRIDATDAADIAIEETPGTTVPAGDLGGFRPTPEQAGPSQLLPEADPESDGLSVWLIPAVLAAFVVLWVVLFGLLIVFAKRRRRRRRRRAATPAERISGAWADSSDRLIETGIGVHPQLTFSETVAAGSVLLGDETVESLRHMAIDVSACAYAAEPPTAAAAERAWLLADEFRRDLRHSRSRLGTTVAHLNPRPLLRRR